MLAGALPCRYLALGSPVVASMTVLVFAVPPGQGAHWVCPSWRLSNKAVLVYASFWYSFAIFCDTDPRILFTGVSQSLHITVQEAEGSSVHPGAVMHDSCDSSWGPVLLATGKRSKKRSANLYGDVVVMLISSCRHWFFIPLLKFFFPSNFKARVWVHLSPRKIAATFSTPMLSVSQRSWAWDQLTPWWLAGAGRKAGTELGTHMQMMELVQHVHRSDVWRRSPESQTVGWVALPEKQIRISPVLPWPAVVSAFPE